MGRDAGWLTASSALTRKICGVGPEPRLPAGAAVDYDKFFADSRGAENPPERRRRRFGGDPSRGRKLCRRGHPERSRRRLRSPLSRRDRPGPRAPGQGRDRLQGPLGRAETFSSARASHIASKTDLMESVDVGKAAVKAAVNGESGRMMTFTRVSDSPYPHKD